MKLRAFSVHGKDVLFSLDDCPVHASGDLVVLAHKRYSEMLKADSIVRTDERISITEGDIVYNRNTGELLGYVIYSSGFSLQSTSGVIKELPMRKDVYIRHRTEYSVKEVVESCMRTPLVFKLDDNIEFGLKAIVKSKNDKCLGILLNKTARAYSVRACTLKWFSGLKDIDGTKFYYGDKLNGDVLVYRNGSPIWVPYKKSLEK